MITIMEKQLMADYVPLCGPMLLINTSKNITIWLALLPCHSRLMPKKEASISTGLDSAIHSTLL